MPQPRQLAESKGPQSRWALAILCLVLCLQVFGEQGKWGRRHARDVLMLRQGGDDDGDSWNEAHDGEEGATTAPPTSNLSPKDWGNPSKELGSRWFLRSIWEALLLKESETLKATSKR